MHRHVVDHWTDTTAFRVALLLAGLPVVPVLLAGVNMTVLGGAAMLAGSAPREIGLEQVAFALLSVGGLLGFVGFLRAHAGVKDPSRHNVTATLACLTVGVLAALSVAGLALASVIESWLDSWGLGVLVLLGSLFAAANLVWAVAGIAWMQRLMRRYAEKTGRPFDGLPVVLLFLAIALATAATLTATTL